MITLELSASDDQENQIELRNNIRESSLLVFLEPQSLSEYFNAGPTGELLQSHMKRNEITNVFWGSNSKSTGGKAMHITILSRPHSHAYYW